MASNIDENKRLEELKKFTKDYINRHNELVENYMKIKNQLNDKNLTDSQRDLLNKDANEIRNLLESTKSEEKIEKLFAEIRGLEIKLTGQSSLDDESSPPSWLIG